MNLYKNNIGSNYNNSLDDCFENFVLKTIYGQDFQKHMLGIINNGSTYHKINSNQDLTVEYIKTLDFLKSLHGLDCVYMDANTKIMFINYGDTELVYVIDDGENKYTLLVSQPNLEFGKVHEEYWNLIDLGKLSDKVVVPLEYISNGTREAFVTPYIYQARCIASYGKDYGSYIPEPSYRFEPFTEDGRYIVNKCMIANLVRLYNDKEKLALASVKVGGGDFILDKSTDTIGLSEENILDNMYLIAARKLIEIDFKDYLKLIREEFAKITYYKSIDMKDKSILINDKNRVPMTKEEIEDGIKLGLYLKK